jgi:hypothetical protein
MLRKRILSIVAEKIDALALTMRMFLGLRRSNHSPTNPLTRKPNFITERFNNAYEKHRDILYKIPGWASVRRFYDEIERLRRPTASMTVKLRCW